MKILKFGGSSVGSPASIKEVMQIIRDARQHDEVHVVVSAFQGVTDQLLLMAAKAAGGTLGYVDAMQAMEERHIDAIKQLVPVKTQSEIIAQFKFTFNELEDLLHGVYLVREASPRTLDVIVSFGERCSAYIVASALSASGIPAGFADARQVIQTDNQFGNARVQYEVTYAKIREYLQQRPGLVHIFTGFIAATELGETTTLGRGGSDFTASIIGAALDAEEIQIWTDVDGVLTADPRKVTRAFPLSQMTYEEAMEMSHFGAKVIYPPTMQPAMLKDIPLRIKNTFNPAATGTMIGRDPGEMMAPIKGISSISSIALIRISGPGMVGVSGVAGRIFETLAHASINVILITQASSEHSVCLAVLPEQAQKAKSSIEEAFKHELRDGFINEVFIETDLCIIAVVGEHMRQTPGIAGRVFQRLGDNGINIVAIAQGSSELNISVVIDKKNEAKALNVLHDAFFLSGLKTVNLYLVGMGLIGSMFLDMLSAQQQILKEQYAIDLRLVGVANSKKMRIRATGIPFDQAKTELLAAIEASNMTTYIDQMRQLNLPNSVFVDCTATDHVPQFYPEILRSSVAVVTPNKMANAADMAFYESLRTIARRYNTSFQYETNVGAGLPIINTLRLMVTTGDQIHKIEGVLSGTLSFLFNTYDGERPFSALLREAREMGYTEPDPRDDLNGHDMGRKLLILAREAGYRLEFADLKIENLVPVAARKAPTVEEFFRILEEYDATFEQRYREAKAQGKVLRYIARFEDGQGVVELAAVDQEHPFYTLSNTDNIVAFTSNHYQTRPMVIKGPGAGAQVTAGGVISDVLRVAQSVR